MPKYFVVRFRKQFGTGNILSHNEPLDEKPELIWCFGFYRRKGYTRFP
jgi:hypothetical protein